jgi:D-glycero-D-manno-heptose 1,7-bisphosphate phosphatase
MKPAVFLDRDGTINQEVSYLNSLAELRLIPGAAEAIASLNAAGFKVVVVTNQAGIGRGYCREADLHSIHTAIQQQLQEVGGRIDGFYYCPHHPTAGLGEYRIECSCRKPAPGMLRRAALEMNLDCDASYMVGDHIKDIQAGKAVGCRTLLVRTGYGRESEYRCKALKISPDAVVQDLAAAARWILQRTLWVPAPQLSFHAVAG